MKTVIILTSPSWRGSVRIAPVLEGCCTGGRDGRILLGVKFSHQNPRTSNHTHPPPPHTAYLFLHPDVYLHLPPPPFHPSQKPRSTTSAYNGLTSCCSENPPSVPVMAHDCRRMAPALQPPDGDSPPQLQLPSIVPNRAPIEVKPVVGNFPSQPPASIRCVNRPLTVD